MDIVKNNLNTIAVELRRLNIKTVLVGFSGSNGRSDGLSFKFSGTAAKYPPFSGKFTYFVSPQPGPASDGKPLAGLRHGDFYTLVEDTFKEDMAARGHANWAEGDGAYGMWAVTSSGDVHLDAQVNAPDDDDQERDNCRM